MRLAVVCSRYSLELGSLVLDLDQFEIEADRSVALRDRDQFVMSLAAANRAFELWMPAPFADVVEPLVVQAELMRLDEPTAALLSVQNPAERGTRNSLDPVGIVVGRATSRSAAIRPSPGPCSSSRRVG